MFPAFFTKVNKMGAPITGMLVMGVVQTLMALSTISPTLSETVRRPRQPGRGHQRHSLYHRPLGAAADDAARRGGQEASTASMWRSRSWRWGTAPVAIYASGVDAVMGGTIVMAIGFIIWGFIASRFAPAQPAAAKA